MVTVQCDQSVDFFNTLYATASSPAYNNATADADFFASHKPRMRVQGVRMQAGCWGWSVSLCIGSAVSCGVACAGTLGIACAACVVTSVGGCCDCMNYYTGYPSSCP